MNKCSYISVLFQYVFYYNKCGFLPPNEINIQRKPKYGNGCNVAKHRTEPAEVVVATVLASSKGSVA